MLKSFFKFGITTRQGIVNIMFVTNAFVWYYGVIFFLQNIIGPISQNGVLLAPALFEWSLHFAGIIISALIGAILGRGKTNRVHLILIWMLIGVVSSIIPIIANLTVSLNVAIISLLFGAALGFGMPNCMGYFTGHTSVENRGRLGGIIMLFSGIGSFLLAVTATGNNTTYVVILSIWRGLGLLIFLLAKPSDEIVEKTTTTSTRLSYKSLLGQRSFILYLVPWIMFCLVNYLSTPVQYQLLGKTNMDFLIAMGNVIMASSAIVGGFMTDYFGRKRMAITGFVLLGLGYSIVGLYPESNPAWYFYTVVNGAAWGILLVIFVVTIWGDLSYSGYSDKYYALGMMPFFVSKFLQPVIGDSIAGNISPYALFSFTAFFLFLAVLPLVYAPETLPEKQMKDRELKNYLEKAQKFVQKDTEKNQKKETKKKKKTMKSTMKRVS